LSDFGTMKVRVSKEVKRGEISASASAVGKAVIGAIGYFERRRFAWNEFQGALKTTVASTTAVTLSVTSAPNILSLDSIRMIIGTRDYPIIHVTWHRIESIDSGQYYGYPEMFAIHSNEVRLYPPPNDAYGMRWAGLFKLDEVSLSASTGATNKWMTDGEEMIRLRAKATIFRDELRNPNLANYFSQEAERVYGELIRETVFKVSSHRVLPTKF